LIREISSRVFLGMRARNENLIFNTIEARLFYYPKTVERIDHFRFDITMNFRIRSYNLVSNHQRYFRDQDGKIECVIGKSHVYSMVLMEFKIIYREVLRNFRPWKVIPQ